MLRHRTIPKKAISKAQWKLKTWQTHILAFLHRQNKCHILGNSKPVMNLKINRSGISKTVVFQTLFQFFVSKIVEIIVAIFSLQLLFPNNVSP